MFRISIYHQIDQFSIAQTSDFMSVRNLISLRKNGYLKSQKMKFGKVSTLTIFLRGIISGCRNNHKKLRFVAWI